MGEQGVPNDELGDMFTDWWFLTAALFFAFLGDVPKYSPAQFLMGDAPAYVPVMFHRLRAK